MNTDNVKSKAEIKSILRKFNRLESINQHNQGVLLLAENFGTQEEIDTMRKIIADCKERGFTEHEEIDTRMAIHNKYYKLLF